MRDGRVAVEGRGRLRLAAGFLAGGLLVSGCSASNKSGADSEQRQSQPALVFVAPEQLAGVPRSEKFARDARQSAEVMKQYVNDPTGTFGAVWTSETSVSDEIRVSAVFGTVINPSIALDRFFSRQRDLQDVAPVEAGPLGGQARCGRSDGHALTYVSTICAWADRGSVAVLSIMSLDKQDRRDEFVTLRAQVQQPSNATATTSK